MLTGALVQVRFSKDLIIPRYVNVDDRRLVEEAEVLLDLFHGNLGEPRGALEQQLLEAFGEEPGQFVRRGLIKLIDGRCDWSVESVLPPEEMREAVFAASFRARTKGPFDRASVIGGVANERNLNVDQVDDGLFADLKSEQRLKGIDPITPDRLLQRYNVALAQSVLLKAWKVTVELPGLKPPRLRRLLRLVKFHRLVCEATKAAADTWQLQLDGPLSLFTSTQKYGLQLALFLPALLGEDDFTLTADLRWGPAKAPKRFSLSPQAGLVSYLPETGTYVPPEVAMFAEQFRKKITGWELHDEGEIISLGDSFWVPDFRLVERGTGRAVYLEILGFWRRGGAEKHLARLRGAARAPYVIALSQSLKVDEGDWGEKANVVQFKQMPLPEAVAAAAAQALAAYDASSRRP